MTEIGVLQDGHDIEKSASKIQKVEQNASELELSLGDNLMNYQAALSFSVRRFRSPPPPPFFELRTRKTGFLLRFQRAFLTQNFQILN